MAKMIIHYVCPRCKHTTDQDFEICPSCGWDNTKNKETWKGVYTNIEEPLTKTFERKLK